MQSGNLNSETIKAHMRALADFEEICSDPCLEETRATVSSATAKNPERRGSESNRRFVQDSLSLNTMNAEDFKDIKIEIRQSDIEMLSVEWVNEWHRKKQSEAKTSPADEERKSFISDSLNAVSEEEETIQPKIVPLRRFAYMAAAAVIGIMILFAALAPSSSPERLYHKYFESFPAITSVTRGSNGSNQANYEQGISYYKASRFPEAAAAFRLAAEENTASLFYLGLSELENNNADQAISALELAAEKQDAYYKEIRWYLGLAWLKKGNKSEAANYFGTLAATEGFYSQRAAEILRRLK